MTLPSMMALWHLPEPVKLAVGGRLFLYYLLPPGTSLNYLLLRANFDTAPAIDDEACDHHTTRMDDLNDARCTHTHTAASFFCVDESTAPPPCLCVALLRLRVCD